MKGGDDDGVEMMAARTNFYGRCWITIIPAPPFNRLDCRWILLTAVSCPTF